MRSGFRVKPLRGSQWHFHFWCSQVGNFQLRLEVKNLVCLQVCVKKGLYLRTSIVGYDLLVEVLNFSLELQVYSPSLGDVVPWATPPLEWSCCPTCCAQGPWRRFSSHMADKQLGLTGGQEICSHNAMVQWGRFLHLNGSLSTEPWWWEEDGSRAFLTDFWDSFPEAHVEIASKLHLPPQKWFF